jgi:hypothetical protein
MTKLDIVGLGTWSPYFGNWNEFRTGVKTGEWQSEVKLQPDLIPLKSRRRAPQMVKMAVEVMSQACEMAAADPHDVATVFSSVMGDMQITDYLCRALSQTPKLVSPTKFHNSVHNAAPGFWSITTGSFSAGSAVSAFEYTPSMALLEACIFAAEEDQPVLLVTQEVAATQPLMTVCPAEQPCSAGVLLAPPGFSNTPLFSLQFSVENQACQWPPLSGDLHSLLGSNMSANLLPMLASLASMSSTAEAETFQFPVSAKNSLHLSLTATAQ